MTSRVEGTRLLGLDVGERRIGVAVADPIRGSVSPLTTIRRSRRVADDAALVARLAAEQRCAVLVVGLPLDMDGSEGAQAAKTREWAASIEAATGLPLRYRDERLTSVRAEQRLGLAGRGASGGPPSAARLEAYRAKIDREAAALILQDELDAMGREAGGTGATGGATTSSGGATTPDGEPSTERERSEGQRSEVE